MRHAVQVEQQQRVFRVFMTRVQHGVIDDLSAGEYQARYEHAGCDLRPDPPGEYVTTGEIDRQWRGGKDGVGPYQCAIAEGEPYRNKLHDMCGPTHLALAQRPGGGEKPR